MSTYFANREVFYSQIGEDGVINTEEFLKASRGIVEFLGIFGTVFSPVKNDVNNNVNKVNAKYITNKEKYSTLQSLVQHDLADNKGKMDVATEGLLWLKRGLQYIRAFLELLIQDHISGTKSDDIVKMLQQAYDKTLKNHHGFFSKKLFMLMTHATPYRKDFLLTLAKGEENRDEDCIKDLQEYMPTFNQNVDALVKYYLDNGLDVPHPDPSTEK